MGIPTGRCAVAVDMVVTAAAAAAAAGVEAEVAAAAAAAAHTALATLAGREREGRSEREWPRGRGLGMLVAAAPGGAAALVEVHCGTGTDTGTLERAAAPHRPPECRIPVNGAAAVAVGRSCLEMGTDPAGPDTAVLVAAEVGAGRGTTRCDGGPARLERRGRMARGLDGHRRPRAPGAARRAVAR